MSRHTMTQLSAKEGESDCAATTGLLTVFQVFIEASLLHDLNSRPSPSTSMRIKSTIFRVDTPVPLYLYRQDQNHTISKGNICLGVLRMKRNRRRRRCERSYTPIPYMRRMLQKSYLYQAMVSDSASTGEHSQPTGKPGSTLLFLVPFPPLILCLATLRLVQAVCQY